MLACGQPALGEPKVGSSEGSTPLGPRSLPRGPRLLRAHSWLWEARPRGLPGGSIPESSVDLPRQAREPPDTGGSDQHPQVQGELDPGPTAMRRAPRPHGRAVFGVTNTVKPSLGNMIYCAPDLRVFLLSSAQEGPRPRAGSSLAVGRKDTHTGLPPPATRTARLLFPMPLSDSPQLEGSANPPCHLPARETRKGLAPGQSPLCPSAPGRARMCVCVCV